MAEINWIENKKGRSYADSEMDVIIRNSTKNGAVRGCIIFIKDSHKKVTHTGYIICGLSSNRIYFKEEDLGRGYKVQFFKSGYPKIFVRADLSEFVGSYKLHLDKEDEALWYIEKEDK